MPPWLLVGGSILSNIIQGNINRDVATKQYGAMENAFNNAKGLYDESISGYTPYTEAGQKALNSYLGLLGGTDSGSFANNPAFKFSQQLLNQRLAKTRQSAGASAQSVYSAPLIAQEYSNTLNRLLPLISGGMSATGATSGLRSNLANLYMNMGQTKASQEAASAPQIASMFGNAVGTYMGAQNMIDQTNYMNSLAKYYTNASPDRYKLDVNLDYSLPNSRINLMKPNNYSYFNLLRS